MEKRILDVEKRVGEKSVLIQEFIFTSRRGINQVFAIIARPKSGNSFPGLLILHPGGSKAKDMQPMVESFASLGYAAMATDLPGICDAEKTTHSDGPWKIRSVDEQCKFDVSQGPQSSVLFDGEVAALEAFNYLSSQPFVDLANMGILGFSWGGYSTTLLSGMLGDRLKAAYSVFGCGFYELGSMWKNILDSLPKDQKETWLKYLDAGRRLSGIRASFFIEAATNDDYFWPNAVSSTFHEILGDKNRVWGANQNHRFISMSGDMQLAFFNHHLRNSEPEFPIITLASQGQEASLPGPSKENQTRQSFSWVIAGKPYVVQIQSQSSCPVQKLLLFYSDASQPWQKRSWDSVALAMDGSRDIPIQWPDSLRRHSIDFFVSAVDVRHFMVSSDMVSTSIPDQEFERPVRVRLKTASRGLRPAYLTGSQQALDVRIRGALTPNAVLGRSHSALKP